jgi:hypothetical protein
LRGEFARFDGAAGTETANIEVSLVMGTSGIIAAGGSI